MCSGHVSFLPLMAEGHQRRFQAVAQDLASQEARRLEPTSQANTKPRLLFNFASCTLFSLQSSEFILLPLSQAISTHVIPGGLLLAAFSRNSGRATEGAQLLGAIPSSPIRAASAENPWHCVLLVCDAGWVTLRQSVPLTGPSVQGEIWLRCP